MACRLDVDCGTLHSAPIPRVFHEFDTFPEPEASNVLHMVAKFGTQTPGIHPGHHLVLVAYPVAWIRTP